ncbi:YihY/virulence factor BrkB family protein [Actinomarinicola tropica]|uniref:YihY family inner membrane protein n=1 Tax=Actinomarinicola tropica TaxID=2789776 RepID=A0A5Q2RMI5_9ACTN|nr:YihY/virulence factor BrkB family protein [Actinomarinicola tropica]QGG95080.1 YihY family inner membrane protein [Actinomarinicola tropica]
MTRAGDTTTGSIDLRRDTSVADAGGDDHGRNAEQPTDIPASGWKAVARRVGQQFKEDRVTLTAAGVAFFGFLAVIPGLVALVSVYGLFGDPDTVQDTVRDVAGTMPEEARDMLVNQLESITSTSGGALTLGLIISLAGALWAASSGMAYLMDALGVVYDEDEERGFVAKRLTAIGLTIGAIVFGIVAIAAITVWPAVVSAIEPPSPLGWLLRLAVWPVLAVALAAALALLYRLGPDREDAEWRWVTPGSMIAVVVWIAASIGFQVYAGNFGSYNETYGSLGAVVIMMLWLWLSAIAVLLGAEINAEMELQTARDTTTGADEPMGARGAEVADNVAHD